jgi:hypothetical protein
VYFIAAKNYTIRYIKHYGLGFGGNKHAFFLAITFLCLNKAAIDTTCRDGQLIVFHRLCESQR